MLLLYSLGVQTLEEWGCHALKPAAHPAQAQYNGPQGTYICVCMSVCCVHVCVSGWTLTM